MDLKILDETNKYPFKCYVKDNSNREGLDVHTLGFKDGIAVVGKQTEQFQDKTLLPREELPPQTTKDNAGNLKSIDVPKLKTITVKTDPHTGKKFVLKDGKRIDIVCSQSSPPLMPKLLPREVPIRPKPKTVTSTPIIVPTSTPLIGPPPLAALTNSNTKGTWSPGILIKKTVVTTYPGQPKPNIVVMPSTFPHLNITPKSAEKVINNRNVKFVDNLAYHMAPIKPTIVSKPVAVICSMNRSDKAQQTEVCVDFQDACTQTVNEFSHGRDSPVSDQFLHFILSDVDLHQTTRKMIDPMNPNTKEDANKLSFFNDLRNALCLDLTGNLPIHQSVLQNDLKAVRKNCVILSALRENVNILNQQSYTPLHLAIIHNADVEIVKTLINQGADLKKTDVDGNTAVHLAIINNNPTLLKILISGRHKTFDFDIHNHDGYTPLILASLTGSYDTAKLLLQHGADPNVRDMKSGRTALFHAAEGQQVDIVELLIQNKADTKIRNFFGTSPHDAMFELDEVHVKIKLSILGKDHVKLQQKRKLIESQSNEFVYNKKPKLQTTPILRKVTSTDVMKSKKK